MLQKLDFTESDCSSSSEALSEKELSAEELNKQLEKLIVEDKANDEQIFDWVEVQKTVFALPAHSSLTAFVNIFPSKGAFLKAPP